MKPYHTNLGRFTLIGRVDVSTYGRPRGASRKKPPTIITSVWVPTYGPTLTGEPRQEWMIQAPQPRRAWPEAARCDGHNVRVTATFGANPHSIGATAYRSIVECADEAEHVMQALIPRKA